MHAGQKTSMIYLEIDLLALLNTYDLENTYLHKKAQMITKLTLSIDDKIVSKAKRIAAKKNTSISKLVSNYFEKLPDNENKKGPSSLLGILKPKDNSIDVEEVIKNARWEHLKKKHGL